MVSGECPSEAVFQGLTDQREDLIGHRSSVNSNGDLACGADEAISYTKGD